MREIVRQMPRMSANHVCQTSSNAQRLCGTFLKPPLREVVRELLNPSPSDDTQVVVQTTVGKYPRSWAVGCKRCHL